MQLKVVLIEDVENLGRVGDVVSVKGGFGRNYLIPQGKALTANKGNMALMASRRQIFEVAAMRQRDQAAVLAARIGATPVTISRKVGESQTLYGSVTTGDIAEKLAAAGVVIDKRRILLTEPIKAVGEYTIPVRLHADVTAELKLVVVAG